MADEPSPTDTLTASVAGKPQAKERLLELLYKDLRQVAGARMSRERPDHTLQPTALVHEAFLRLVDQDRVNFQGKSHFLSVAARVMRRILVDHAKGKTAQKRGGHAQGEVLDEEHAASWDDPVQLLALDEALHKLAKVQPRQAKVIELRFFGGLSLEETAKLLGVSRDTVKIDWRFARAWLNQRLGSEQ